MGDRHESQAERLESAAGAALPKHTTPRWVIVSAVVAALFVIGFIALHLAGGGFRGHGP